MKRLVGGCPVGGFGRMRRALGCAGLVVLVAAAGCGGQSKADGASGAEKAGADAAAGSTSTTGPGADGKAGSDKGKGKAAGGSTATTTGPGGAASGTTSTTEDPWAKTLEISAELASECVRPGGTQTITITTLPASGVGYDSVYSDGRSGAMEGFYGGNAGGFTDPEGTFTHAWVVGANAPAGEVIVRVLGTHTEGGFGETRAYFTVSNALGTCS